MRRETTRLRILWLGGALATTVVMATLIPAVAVAEQRLHERVIDPTREDSPLLEQPAEGRNPAALRLPQMDIAEPRHSSDLRSDEQPFQTPSDPGAPGAGPDRSREFRPDLQTAQTADVLNYHSSFNPSISPHKRLSALDRVGADYVLSVAAPALQELTVGGTASEDRDLFWGSVVVQFQPNRQVPIPSVAPEARILSVRTRPELPIRFFRDGAGNYSVMSDQAGQCRVVFVTDAPGAYFGAVIPPAVTAADVPQNLRPQLPPNVAQAATQVMGRLGLDGRAPLARNLTRLISYLRAFRMEPLTTPPGADPYLSLAFGRRGVCRHRAFVFVVTAQALGIPARIVTNEVHAFAEIYVPTVGWVRVDLGGEARLAPESEAVAHHQPRSPDPFPWPPGSRVATGTGQGRPGQSNQPGNQGQPGQQPGNQPDAGVGQQAARPGDPNAVSGTPGPDGTEAVQADPSASTTAASVRLVVYLDRHSANVVRGEALSLSGAVHASAGPVAGAQVRLSLRRSAAGTPIYLGRVTCGPDGRFQARFSVPSSVPTGDYAIVARAAHE